MSRFITLMVAVFIATTAHAAPAPSYSADAACVQAELKMLGYELGTVDGVAGPKTQALVAKAALDLGFTASVENSLVTSFACEDFAKAQAKKSGDPNLLFITDLDPSNSVFIRIQSGVRAARALLGDKDVQGTIYVLKDRKALLSAAGMSDEKWGTKWAVTTESASYLDATQFPDTWEAAKVAGHEYTHIHQSALSGGGPIGGNPFWIVEGMAEYVGYQSAGETGKAEWKRQMALLNPYSLAKLETYSGCALAGQSGKCPAYTMGGAAVEFLVSFTSFDTAVNEYWKDRKLSGGTVESWMASFEKASHVSVGKFYIDFQRYLTSGRIIVLGKAD